MKIKGGKFWRGKKSTKHRIVRVACVTTQCKLGTEKGVRLADALGLPQTKGGRNCESREEG